MLQTLIDNFTKRRANRFFRQYEEALREKNSHMAILYLQKAISCEPASWVFRKAMFWQYLEQRNLKDARAELTLIEQFCDLTNLDLPLSELYWHLGKWHLWMGQNSQAILSLERCVELNPDNLIAWHELGNALYYVGEETKSVSARMKSLPARDREALRMGQALESSSYFLSRWTCAIGHIAALGAIAKIKELGWNREVTNYLVLDKARVANLPLLKYLIPFFKVIEEPAQVKDLEAHALSLQDPIGLFRAHDKFHYYYPLWAEAEFAWEESRKPPLIALSEEESKAGWEKIGSFGIPEGSRFVTIHVREAGFYGQSGTSHAMLRNSNIRDYIPALEWLTQLGIYVFRIGDSSMAPLPKLPRLIDLAHHALKSSELDVFLLANCWWMISTNSGPAMVPHLFGRNALHTNWVPLSLAPAHPKDLLIPKWFSSRETGQNLSFEGVLKSQLARGESSSLLDLFNVDVAPNSPEELLQSVQEMFHKETTPQPETDFQRKFREIAWQHGIICPPRVSDYFLRQRANLFFDR